MKTLEHLLREIDQIAVVIRDGSAAQQRTVFTALFERVEVLGEKIIVATPRNWARAFLNGHEMSDHNED